MSRYKRASDLTLAQYHESLPKFHWLGKEGSVGPIVTENYEPIPEHLGNYLGRVLNWSDRSYVALVQLVTEDGKEDLVAAKIMQSSSNKEKLTNELKILQNLRHKHIAAVLGNFSTDGGKDETHYGLLVFPLVAKDLQDLLEAISKHNESHEKEGAPWPLHQHTHKLLPYFACLCETVLFLHNQDRPIKHRDIKPANILIDRFDNVILADFDISKAYDDVKNAITYGSLDGTIMYSSKDVWKTSKQSDPEGSKRGLEWDVVSLAFVFLEMATVLFGETLHNMRKPMKRLYEGCEKPTVRYSEEDLEIEKWLGVLEKTAKDTPWKLPEQFTRSIHAEPCYVENFLGAIRDMMSAKRNNHDSLKQAWGVFGRLSGHCPSPQFR
ncbi:unnamed protein product [Aureobasidium uvarum]|uniref:Protein kinase domain-containing protein n=1 Tax=Aureobasidium uvarum TaxID=2773716 RepID=A0A9N8KHJ7_9PEZI|nr:unnamed protein product [Aureobasidium uvarum]